MDHNKELHKKGGIELKPSIQKTKKPGTKKRKSTLLQAYDELTMLNRLVKSVTAQISLQEACNAAVREIAGALGLEVVTILIQEGDELHLKTAGPTSSYLQAENIPVHIVGECLCGQAARAGRILFSANIHKDRRCTWSECKQAGLHSFAAIPLRVGDEPVGVLGIGSESERDFKQHSRFLKTAADHLAVSIHHARLLEQTQMYAARLESQIAERRKTEEMLQKNRSELMAILDNLPFLAWLKDSGGQFIAVNVPFSRACGHSSPEELIGKTDFDIWPKHLAEGYIADDKAVMRSGNKKAVEEVISDQGVDKWFETYKAPLFGPDGKVIGTTGFSRDITDRKQADEALRSSEERLRLAMEATQQGWFDLNIQTGEAVNSAEYLNILGYGPAELNSTLQGWMNAIHPEDREAVLKVFNECLESGDTRIMEYRRGTKAGEWKWLRSIGKIVEFDADRKPLRMSGTHTDITERKQAEEALRFSEEKYRLVVENANDAIFIVQNEKIKFPNRQTIFITGYTEEELASVPFSGFIHQDDREMVVNRHRKRLQGQDVPTTYNFRVVNKSEKLVWVEASIVLITWEGSPAALVFLRDITVQKKLEEQLLHAQKMEAIGTLAGGIAHDFNNLLMGILGYTSLMLMKSDKSHPFHEKLKIIEQQVESGSELTKQLLGFARGGRYEVKPVSINELIMKTSDMFGRTKKEIMIHKKLREDLRTIEADSGQIEQVLFNLYVNAWQAMPAGGKLYLETQNTTLDERYCLPYNAAPGNYIKITITDTGVGMDTVTQKRIFEPFFTTKGLGKGTGLGLASVYGIVKNHKGIINVYSERGIGTTFTIYLPASEKEAAATEPNEETVLTGEETILIVDDEPANTEAVKQILEILGYKVETARSGHEAVELYHSRGKGIHLVILDMIMPGMNGKETFERLKEIEPEVKVLLSSGYSINGEAKNILELGCRGFIQKPFRVDELSRKIRDVLDRTHL